MILVGVPLWLFFLRQSINRVRIKSTNKLFWTVIWLSGVKPYVIKSIIDRIKFILCLEVPDFLFILSLDGKKKSVFIVILI